ncbi:dihydrolipoyl dehydrogenase [Desulforhopalus vacuolatus]|uniref:dihydrolipoyl dehydrogenase n=1 Tax=Desulforhopalus vacuolatus TaxID=40414 RepID=UPI0019659A86|nr:dihydrolipoyl dehydrogenase [Desulforhopalus vacuolatus]MBM9519617.1 dihydrolipoyl dehydrogenase [Desulforhopalus vacuolatus]
MQTKNVDVAVIGGGTAGLNARRSALAYTDSVVLIEGGIWGTTCARVGCMPSKLLIAAAESVHAIERAPGFGVHTENAPCIKGDEVMGRVLAERDRFVGFVLEGVDNIPPEQKIIGNARFLDNHTLDIGEPGELRIKAKRIVIATGSHTVIPASLAKFSTAIITNDDLFSMKELPQSVAVFGSGVIGLELTQALHRLGVDVRLFGRSGRIRPITDPKLRDYTEEALNEEYYVAPKDPVTSMEEDGDRVKITYTDRKGKEAVFHAQYLFAATGRRPSVENLGLENTDLELDSHGIPTVADRNTMQTSVPTIFIAGDASNQSAILHEATDQGRIAGANAGSYPEINHGLRRSNLSIVFSDPQIAMIGDSYGHLQKEYGKNGFSVGEVSFTGQGRARTMLRNKGMLRVYGDRKSSRFLGAEMFGPDAEHLGHLLAWAHQMELTVEKMLEMPFYHPTVEEGVRTALQDLQKKMKKDKDKEEDRRQEKAG